MSSESSQCSESSQNSESTQRRVGRVERWLRKGYGFVTDLGALVKDDANYGWSQDKMSGNKVFVYHSALLSESDNVFHRLFANEYVEYTIDLTKQRENDRIQAFDVTGLNGSELLCDLNAASEASNNVSQTTQTSQTSRVPRSRSRRSEPTSVVASTPAPTVVYYVPIQNGNVGGALPQGLGIPQGFPPVAQMNATNTEPSYVMPANGIPVPK